MLNNITAKLLRQKAKEISPDSLSSKARIAILGYRSTQFLAKLLEQSGRIQGCQFEIYEADYQQVEMEVFNPESDLYLFKPDYIFIIHSSEQLRNQFYQAKDPAHFSEKVLATIQNLQLHVSKQTTAPIIFTNFEDSQQGVFGNFANKVRASFPNQVRRINVGLMDLAEKEQQVHILDLAHMVHSIGMAHFQDAGLHVNADIPFNFDAEAKIAWEMTQMLQVFLGKLKKCLILDLDNTLWGGVIGDDGLEGIQLGTLGIGKAFTALQKWAKQLKERGIILAICSKNQEDIAKAVFEQHEDMVLRLEDIAVFMANWSNKADNIRHIQQVLNIGFDSMVFLDDNPAERGLIRAELPEVFVPDLPQDPAEYMPFLRKLNLFETVSHSSQDKDRTKQYQEEAQRRSIEQFFTNMDDYYKSLEMIAHMGTFQDSHIPRIAQLSQRSNQFNLRTIRYAEAEIKDIQHDDAYFDYEIHLEDAFGKYGLISVIILKEQSEKSLFIETWLMSCRVLKRDVEKFALNRLVQDALANGYETLIGEYLPTPKNKIVENHYEDLGFKLTQEGKWELNLQDFVFFDHFIEGED